MVSTLDIKPLAGLRLLVTGAGGPAAIGFMKDLEGHGATLIAADADPMAAGLYLVPEDQRVLLPLGRDPGFVDAVLEACIQLDVDGVVPTCDAELIPLAQRAKQFERLDIWLATSRAQSLSLVLDKWLLHQRCRSVVPVPVTTVAPSAPLRTWNLPVILKPRVGSGSRGIRLVETHEELGNHAIDTSLICQEFLPGAEYSVDCFAGHDGRVIAAVPRERLKVDSGVAMTSRTVRDPELQALAVAVVEALDLRYAVNVQFRRDVDGQPRLLEINPRLAGTMRLTSLAGINLPLMTVLAASGRKQFIRDDDALLPFSDTVIVRTLQEHVVSGDELDAMRTSTATQPFAKAS